MVSLMNLVFLPDSGFLLKIPDCRRRGPSRRKLRGTYLHNYPWAKYCVSHFVEIFRFIAQAAEHSAARYMILQ
jgi:hypothetical protein